MHEELYNVVQATSMQVGGEGFSDSIIMCGRLRVAISFGPVPGSASARLVSDKTSKRLQTHAITICGTKCPLLSSIAVHSSLTPDLMQHCHAPVAHGPDSKNLPWLV